MYCGFDGAAFVRLVTPSKRDPVFGAQDLTSSWRGRSNAAPFEFSGGMRLTQTVIAGLVPAAFTHLSCRLRSPRPGQASAVPLRLSSRPSDRPMKLSGGARAGLPTSLQVVFCGDCPPRLLCGGGFVPAIRARTPPDV